MKKTELIEKCLNNEIVSNNYSKAKVDQIIKMNTRSNFDSLTVKKNHIKLFNIIVKKAEILQAIRKQRKVKRLDIIISWSRGSMQAMQSQAEANIQYIDGYGSITTSKTSGWGYDKESTTMAEILNDTIRYMIIDKKENKKAPYGVTIQNDIFNNRFNGGVGVSCYYSIIKYLGGTLKNTINTKTSNVYTITF